VVTTEGAIWKRHRAVANPAFDEVSSIPSHFFSFSFLEKANTALVWFETNRLLAEWFALIQARKDGEYHVLDLIPELMEACDALYSQ
jgi:hypothetical protein